MKKIQKKLKAGLAVALIAAVAGSYPNMPSVTTSANQTKEIYEEYFIYDEMETSAYPISFFSAETGTVDIAEGNHEKWIDRIDLPNEAKELYQKLEEGSDNDGVDDFLIDDKYYAENSDNIIGSNDSKCNVITAFTKESNGKMSDNEVNYLLKCITVLMNAFDRDHPEVFWLSGASKAMMSASSSDGITYQNTFYFVLKQRGKDAFDIRDSKYESQTDIETAIAKRDSDIEKICKGIPENADTYEKMVYFNKYLTEHNEYNTSSDLDNIDGSCRECISALAGAEGTLGPVCEAYARAFKVLCDKEGIPCVLVDGHAKNSATSSGEAHMWNYAKLGDKWYGVDVTWDDPKVAGKGGVISGHENENYLLVGSNTMIDGMKFIESHPVSNKVSTNGPGFINGPDLNAEKYEPTVSINIAENPVLKGVYGTAVKDMSFTDGIVKSGEKIVEGTWEITDTAKTEKPSVNSTKAYKVSFTPDNTNNTSYPNVDTEIVPEVTAKSLSAESVTISDITDSFIYDGQEKKPSLKIEDSEAEITENDYTIEYQNNIKPSTDSVKAKAIIKGKENYTGEIIKEFMIEKADGEEKAVVEQKEYFYEIGSDGVENIDLSSLLLEDMGKVTYTIKNTTGEIISSTASINNNILSYTVNPGTKGDTAEIVITAETEYYTDITITIKIAMCDKTEIVLKEGSKVALETDTLIYGESLSKLKFKDTEAVFLAEGTDIVVHGTLSWKDEDMTLSAGSHNVAWVFTPESNRYQSKEGVITVNVEKAEQTGFAIKEVTGKAYGDTGFTLETIGGNNDGAVTYDVPENNKVLSVNGNMAEILGAGTVKVSAIKAESENYKEAKAEIEITILPKSLKTEGITISEITVEYTYQGTEIMPSITVSDKETELVKGTDYDMAYRNNINASTETEKAEIIITGKGNYKDELKTSFIIQKAGSKITVEEEAIEKIYSTEPFAVKAVVNSDAEIQYTVTSGSSIISTEKNNVTMKKVGTAEITVSAPATANYHAAENCMIRVTVLPAENAPNMPSNTMEVEYSNAKVKDVVLPEGWAWQEIDAEKELIVNTVVTAAAIYSKDDKDNYKNISVIISLNRKANTNGDNTGNTGGDTGNNNNNNNTGGNTGNTGNTGSNTGNSGNTNNTGGTTGGNTGSIGGTTGNQTGNKEESSEQKPNNNTGNNDQDNNKIPEKEPENGKTVETKEDGTIVETVTEEKEDGTKVQTVTETRKDGIIVETVTEEKLGSDTTGNINIEIPQKAVDSGVSGKKNITIIADVSSKENAEVEKIILTKDGIDTAKNAGKGLVIKVITSNDSISGSYQVTIPAKQLKKLEGTCNIAVSIEKAKEAADSKIKTSLTKALTKSKGTEDKACIVSIRDTEIKAGMKITVPAAEKINMEDNNVVYVYKYNEKTGKLAEAAYCKQVLSSNGNIVISAKEGTSYILSAKKLKGKQVETIKSQISVTASKKSVKIGKTAKLKVDLPDTVSTKTGFAKEKVVITYRSNDTKIASVSKTGVIKAKKTGVVTITTTISLESGQDIKKKQEITIK